MIADTTSQNASQPDFGSVAAKSATSSRKRSLILFSGNDAARSAFIPSVDPTIHKASVARRVRLQYPVIPPPENDGGKNEKKKKTSKLSMTARVLQQLRKDKLNSMKDGDSGNSSNRSNPALKGQIVVHREDDFIPPNIKNNSASSVGILALPGQTIQKPISTGTADAGNTDNKSKANNQGDGILVKKSNALTNISIPKPKWHPPWELSTVISSHLGWVRSIAFDHTNDIFATGAADRTIKIFDFPKACVGANDALKITLTGHVSPIRGLAFSPRHPYLFSAGEDKMVKCWDLETNQVVRHYHGHLSGVFDLKLHPTLDLLVTGGRDAVARVWDMRTRHQVHCLTGHDNTVGAILTKPSDPQIITGSYDCTIKLWDLVAGRCMATLTHHKKAIRALAQPSFENTFMSGAADTIKKWQAKEGRFIKSLRGHKTVLNSLAINDDGVAVSGADNGTINFWDYKSGYCFQKTETVAQPGSLDAENGVYVAAFDMTGTRLVTGEADKTIKIWKQNEEASELSHPINMKGWRKQCLAEARHRK